MNSERRIEAELLVGFVILRENLQNCERASFETAFGQGEARLILTEEDEVGNAIVLAAGTGSMHLGLILDLDATLVQQRLEEGDQLGAQPLVQPSGRRRRIQH